MKMPKIVGLLTNTLYLKIFFLVVMFLGEIPLIMPYFIPWQKVGLIWAAVILLIDMLTQRRCLKSRYTTLSILFLVCMGITVFLNHATAFRANAIEFAYTITLFLVLFPSYFSEDRPRLWRELSILNILLSVMTAIVAVIGLYMFVAQYASTVTYGGVEYPVGFVNNRLNGLYRNAIYPTAAIGMLVSVLQIAIHRLRCVRYRAVKAIGLSISALLNLICVCLANSKGIFIGLLAFVLIAACFFAYKGLDRVLKAARECWLGIPVKSVLSLAVAGCCLLGTVAGIRGIREGASYVPALFYREPATPPVSNPEQPEKPKPPSKIDLDKNVPDIYGPMTGRPIIWKQGIQYFLEKPAFGYGPHTLSNAIKIEGSNEKLSHFHNIFIQSLVSVGAVGSLFFVAFLFFSIFTLARFAFTKWREPDHTAFILLMSLLAFLLVINQGDTTILFMLKHSSFVFFIYLGYAVALAAPKKPSPLDAPARTVDRLFNQVFHREKGPDEK